MSSTSSPTYWSSSSRRSSLDPDMANFDINQVSYRNSPNPSYGYTSYGWGQPYAASSPQVPTYGNMPAFAYSTSPSASSSSPTSKRSSSSRLSSKPVSSNGPELTAQQRLEIEAGIREAVKRHDKDEALRLFRERGESFKDIERYWPTLFGEQSTAGALRMRASRGKRARREWEDSDTEFCRRAIHELSKNQFEFVSQEMRRLGCDKRWSPQECEKHWLDACANTRTPGGGLM